MNGWAILVIVLLYLCVVWLGIRLFMATADPPTKAGPNEDGICEACGCGPCDHCPTCREIHAILEEHSAREHRP